MQTTHFNQTFEEIQKESIAKGSHVGKINKFVNDLKLGPLEIKNFRNNLMELKTLRKQADYEEIQIDSSLGANGIAKAKTIIQTLKKNFKI